MNMTFSHIGEAVVAQMANANPRLFIEALGLSNKEVDWRHIHSAKPFAYANCKLPPLGDLAFDGQHQVDVALWVKPKSAIALELKLGVTRVDRNSFKERFLTPCGRSHGGLRIKGSMIAILERRFERLSVDEDLCVNLTDKKTVKLASTWGLLMQQSVIDNWQDGLKTLSGHAVLRSVQELVHDCGGKRKFNSLVKKVVNFDYFDEWNLNRPIRP